MQVQHGFSGASLSALAGLGLGVYALIPDFRDHCPLCDGAGCAVRHGLYHRRVVDRDGLVMLAFPIPRFRCRRYGPRASETVTFSVLPAELVPRRLCSLPFMLAVLELFLAARSSMRQVLDAVADSFHDTADFWLAEATTVYRMARLLAQVHVELRSRPLPGLELRGSAETRTRASQMMDILSPPGRSSPLVLEFHARYFPRLLLEPSRSAPAH